MLIGSRWKGFVGVHLDTGALADRQHGHRHHPMAGDEDVVDDHGLAAGAAQAHHVPVVLDAEVALG